MRTVWSRVAVVGMVVVAAIASIASSPARRFATQTYEEVITLTAEAPSVTRHFRIDVTNRDVHVYEVALIAGAYSTEPGKGIREEETRVSVSIVPDTADPRIKPSRHWTAKNLSFLEYCRPSCQTGVTVEVELTRIESAPLAANLVVDLTARSDEVGTEPADVDLTLQVTSP